MLCKNLSGFVAVEESRRQQLLANVEWDNARHKEAMDYNENLEQFEHRKQKEINELKEEHEKAMSEMRQWYQMQIQGSLVVAFDLVSHLYICYLCRGGGQSRTSLSCQC